VVIATDLGSPIGTVVTVTKPEPQRLRCLWCNRPFDHKPGAGRPRKFCCRSHRQRAFEARRRADELEVPPGQVIVSEDDLKRLHDRLYRLESAIDDTEADLSETSSAPAYKAAFEHLHEAARDLAGVVIEPVRV
jgi:hypothetical protein